MRQLPRITGSVAFYKVASNQTLLTFFSISDWKYWMKYRVLVLITCKICRQSMRISTSSCLIIIATHRMTLELLAVHSVGATSHVRCGSSLGAAVCLLVAKAVLGMLDVPTTLEWGRGGGIRNSRRSRIAAESFRMSAHTKRLITWWKELRDTNGGQNNQLKCPNYKKEEFSRFLPIKVRRSDLMDVRCRRSSRQREPTRQWYA